MLLSNETFQSEENHLLFWFNKFIFCFKYLYPALFQEDFKAAGMFTAQISAQ